jgi:hypothetical protein
MADHIDAQDAVVDDGKRWDGKHHREEAGETGKSKTLHHGGLQRGRKVLTAATN